MVNEIASAQPFTAESQPSPAAQNMGAQSGDTAQKPPLAPQASKPAPPAEPLLRLEIKDDGRGRYIYTLTDRDTGRTVVEIPRETLAHMASDANYTAGAVVSTKA